MALFILLSPFLGMYAQINGCTDPLSLNYNKNATINDGSCQYADSTVTPSKSFVLADTLRETSGLIFWDGRLITQNDSDDTHLYALNPSNGAIEDVYALAKAKNKDWEEISQDQKYVYIGDFGNNLSGNRTDLHILRVDKQSLLNRMPKIDTIRFSYSDQTDLSPRSPNTTNFDCEAFFVRQDKIFLITKQWEGKKSNFYQLPKTPGNHTAQFMSTLDVQGLTTGCVFLENKHILALTGYNQNLSPFIYLLYDFENTDFLGANKRKLKLNLPLHQVEAITSQDGLDYFITNEYFNPSQQNAIPQQLHRLDLSTYLEDYLNRNGLGIGENSKENEIKIYPNPGNGHFFISGLEETKSYTYKIIDMYGNTIFNGRINKTNNSLDLNLTTGIYFCKLEGVQQAIKLIKK